LYVPEPSPTCRSKILLLEPMVLTLKEAPLIAVRGESERDGNQW